MNCDASNTFSSLAHSQHGFLGQPWCSSTLWIMRKKLFARCVFSQTFLLHIKLALTLSPMSLNIHTFFWDNKFRCSGAKKSATVKFLILFIYLFIFDWNVAEFIAHSTSAWSCVNARRSLNKSNFYDTCLVLLSIVKRECSDLLFHFCFFFLHSFAGLAIGRW